MKVRFIKLIAVMAILLMGVGSGALAQQAVNTTVTMRVSHMTQNAVVNVGEDLSIEVNIDGVEPDSYQWYFNDAAIQGADQKVLNIVDAQLEDAGIYRMDAFDADGAMLVSMDISARVVDDVVPQAGDRSLPVNVALGGATVCAAAFAMLLRRRVRL